MVVVRSPASLNRHGAWGSHRAVSSPQIRLANGHPPLSVLEPTLLETSRAGENPWASNSGNRGWCVLPRKRGKKDYDIKKPFSLKLTSNKLKRILKRILQHETPLITQSVILATNCEVAGRLNCLLQTRGLKLGKPVATEYITCIVTKEEKKKFQPVVAKPFPLGRTSQISKNLRNKAWANQETKHGLKA